MRNEIERRKTVKNTHNTKKQADSESDSEACRIPLLQMQSPETMQKKRVFVLLKIRIYRHFMNDRKNYHSTTIQEVHLVLIRIWHKSLTSLGTTITTHYNEFEGIGLVDINQDSSQSELVEFIPDLFYMPGTNSSGTNSGNVIETTYLNIYSKSDNAGGIQLAQSLPGDTEIDKTIPMVCQVTVHRGVVCRDSLSGQY